MTNLMRKHSRRLLKVSERSSSVENPVEAFDTVFLDSFPEHLRNHTAAGGSGHLRHLRRFWAHAVRWLPKNAEALQELLRSPGSKTREGDLTMRRIAIMIASIAVLGTGAAAQEARSEIGLQGTGFFTTDTAGQGTTPAMHQYRRLSCRLPVFFQPLAGSRRRLRLRPEHSRVFCSCRIRESSGQY